MLSAHTHPDAESLRREIERTRALTGAPFGVNLTVLPSLGSRDFDGYARVIVEMGVPVVETSGGNPAKYIALFKQHGITVLHKVSSSLRFALKAQELGADAVTLHGFECAGHPGEDDIPGLVLIPAAARTLRLPVLCSGGIADGRGLAAVLALGGEGVVMGTRFMLTQESFAARRREGAAARGRPARHGDGRPHRARPGAGLAQCLRRGRARGREAWERNGRGVPPARRRRTLDRSLRSRRSGGRRVPGGTVAGVDRRPAHGGRRRVGHRRAGRRR